MTISKTTKTSDSPKAFKIEMWAIDRLVPFEQNAKKHDQEQITRLARVFKKSGWDQPIVAWPIPGTDKGEIIKGHGRRLGAIEAGFTHVPVIVRDDLTKAEADAARISDNAVTSTQYDTRALKLEIERLSAEMVDFDAADLGLTEKDQKLLLQQIDVPDMDAIMADTNIGMAEKAKEDDERVAKADANTVNVSEAFGFKKVSLEQMRVIARFIDHAESCTGHKGVEAMTSFMESVIP